MNTDLMRIYVYFTFGIGVIAEIIIFKRWLSRIWRFILRK